MSAAHIVAQKPAMSDSAPDLSAGILIGKSLCYNSRVILSRLTRLALAGLMICCWMITGCVYGPDEARRGLIVAGGPDAVYVLNAVSGDLYELQLGESHAGSYRRLPYETDPGISYHPVAQLDNQKSLKLYGTGPDGPIEITIIKGEESLITETGGLGMSKDETLLAVDGNEAVFATPDGIRIAENESDYLADKPGGDFTTPVAAKARGTGWLIVWPHRIEHPKPKKGWSDFSLIGAGRTGEFIVQAISPGGATAEYRLKNDTYAETRPTGLLAAAVDAEGRLLLLDDKGYITIYDGELMLANYYAGLSPSRYAVNTMSPGPEGYVLITDAAGNMVNMMNTGTGRISHSWRLPPKEKKIDDRFVTYGCIIDALLLALVIVLIISIANRMRRFRRYRGAGE
jgi:hypothetical protein